MIEKNDTKNLICKEKILELIKVNQSSKQKLQLDINAIAKDHHLNEHKMRRWAVRQLQAINIKAVPTKIATKAVEAKVEVEAQESPACAILRPEKNFTEQILLLDKHKNDLPIWREVFKKSKSITLRRFMLDRTTDYDIFNTALQSYSNIIRVDAIRVINQFVLRGEKLFKEVPI